MMDKNMKKILIMGTDPVSFGAGIELVMVSPDPRVMMASKQADAIYVEPLNAPLLRRIMRKERPDGVYADPDASAAVAMVAEMSESGWLEEHGIRVLDESDIFPPDTASCAGDAVAKDRCAAAAKAVQGAAMPDKYMPSIGVEVVAFTDGIDVLIPGVAEYVGQSDADFSGSIGVSPAMHINDREMRRVIDMTERLARETVERGAVNIKYLLFGGTISVVEIASAASATMVCMSRVRNIDAEELEARLLSGEQLDDIGFGAGLYRKPPYFCVKVPGTSGDAFGIGRTAAEAMFKGLAAAGFAVPEGGAAGKGVLLSVETKDSVEIMNLGRRFAELGMPIFATHDTAEAIRSSGREVTEVLNVTESDEILAMMDEGKLGYIIYTGASYDETEGAFAALYGKALELGIPCVTSVETASAIAEMLEGRYSVFNTELIDVNNLRTTHRKVDFVKMQDGGSDYLFIENFDDQIDSPESLCVPLCDRHTGIGADGIVIIERSDVADARMRAFNRDGSGGQVAGNSLRCVAKILYDRGYVKREAVTVETETGVKSLRVYLSDGKVNSASVDMGCADFSAAAVPVVAPEGCDSIEQGELEIGGKKYVVSCLSVGNPHCVVFSEEPEEVDMSSVGPAFENAPLFPKRVNTEFIKVIDPYTIRARVYERGIGETMSCGTGAVAAVAAAVRAGLCPPESDITVKFPGGNLVVNYSDGRLTLIGGASEVFEGRFEY